MPCTTFSILFARYKGDLVEMARGAAVLTDIGPDDRILIAEACSHHAIEDDIGRVKIPRWIRQYVGADVAIDTCAGRDYPEDLARYRLVIHCGGCMLTRREMLSRIEEARREGVAVTNYGVAISVLQGVIERTLSPFPAAWMRSRGRRRGSRAGRGLPRPEREMSSARCATSSPGFRNPRHPTSTTSCRCFRSRTRGGAGDLRCGG